MTRASVLVEVSAERDAQDVKWGDIETRTVPATIVDPTTATEWMCPVRYGIPSEQLAKLACDLRTEEGTVTWGDVLVEELSEAITAACESPAKARGELVQLAAVCVAAIEWVDAREGKP